MYSNRQYVFSIGKNTNISMTYKQSPGYLFDSDPILTIAVGDGW